MIGLLTLVLPLLPGFLLNFLHDKLSTDASVATNRDNLATQERLARTKAEVDRRNAQRDVLVAEQQHWFTALPRALLGYIVAFYIAKLVIWDKVFGLGATDNLSDDLWEVFKVIIGGYFLDGVATRISRRIGQ